MSECKCGCVHVSVCFVNMYGLIFISAMNVSINGVWIYAYIYIYIHIYIYAVSGAFLSSSGLEYCAGV